MKSLKFLALVTSLSAALALWTGCETSGDDERTSGRVVDDKKITERVEERLQHEPVFKFSDVDVKTFNGVVQLSGFVNTEEQKQRAAELAQQTPGVAQVVNSIALKAQTPGTPTGRQP